MHASDASPAMLPNSETWLRLVAEQIPALLWTTDTEMRFTSGMGAGLAALHLTPGQLNGVPLTTYFGTSDPDYPPLAAHRRALLGERVSYEHCWSNNAYQVHIEPMRDRGDQIIGCIGLALDVTQRKNAEEKLRESEECFSKAFSASPVAMAIISLDDRETLDVNGSFLRMAGYLRSEALNGPLTELGMWSEPDDRVRIQDLVSREDVIRDQQCRFQDRNGARRTAVISSENIEVRGRRCMLIIAEDVTDHLMAECKLKDFNERFEDLTHNIPGILYQIGGKADGSTLRVPYVSSQTREYWGIEPEEILANPVLMLDIIHPDDRPSYYEKALQSMSSLSPFLLEFRIVARNGDVRWMRACSRPRVLKNGELLYNGIAIDITDRKQAEDALRQARDQMGAFVHDRMRNMLEINEQLTLEIQEREQAQEKIQAEQRLLRRLLDLQDCERKLIAYEIHDGFLQQIVGAHLLIEGLGAQQPDQRIERRKLKDIQKLLSDAINEGRRLISDLRPIIIDEKGVVEAVKYLIVEEYSAGKPEVHFTHDVRFERLPSLQEGIIFRIVQEALTNVRRHSQASRAEVRLAQLDGHLRLEVKDNGIGFDPRQVSDARFGLEGIRERSRLFGGSASITSVPGQGTNIVVILPIRPLLEEEKPPTG